MSTQKPVVLKLGGRPFNPRPPKPSVLKIIAHLDQCPCDEIFAHAEVSRKLGLDEKYLTHHCSEPALQPYTAVVNRARYYGHQKAIAELKRQTGGER